MALTVIRSSPARTFYPPRAVTVLAFRSRFTQTEKVKLELASLDNPAAELGPRQAAAVLRVFLADVATARYIDLENATTRAGVQLLENIGLLDGGRAVTILDALIMDVERPEMLGFDESFPDPTPDPEPAPEPEPEPTP